MNSIFPLEIEEMMQPSLLPLQSLSCLQMFYQDDLALSAGVAPVCSQLPGQTE